MRKNILSWQCPLTGVALGLGLLLGTAGAEASRVDDLIVQIDLDPRNVGAQARLAQHLRKVGVTQNQKQRLRPLLAQSGNDGLKDAVDIALLVTEAIQDAKLNAWDDEMNPPGR